MASECRWCGRANEGNAGDYYHEKDCHRKDVLRRLDLARGRGESTEALKEELERASYTGD